MIPHQPFDLVNDVLNSARVRLNDALASLSPTSGRLLDNTQAFSQQGVNNAWRRLQEALYDLGYTDFKKTTELLSVPVVGSSDPASTVWVDWFNYFDGVNLWPAPVLPEDFMHPLFLWERPSGFNANYVPMELANDGLPTWAKQLRNGIWEYSGNRVVMPGSQQVMDIRLRYASYLADFEDGVNQQGVPIRWFEQRIPMMRALNAFSWYLCHEIASGRDDLDASRFAELADEAMRKMMNRDIAMKQRTNNRRQSRSGRNFSGDQYYGFC